MKDKILDWINTRKPVFSQISKLSLITKETLTDVINDCLQDIDGWVSVEDRPKDMQRVLYVCKHGLIDTAQYRADSDRFRVYGLRINPVDITHWKPLPELPRGGND